MIFSATNSYLLPTHNLAVAGRLFIAGSLIGFGIQHLVYGEFVTRLTPKLSADMPAQAVLAYLVGLNLIAVGTAIALAHRAARLLLILLGSAILLSFTVLHLPPLVANPHNGAWWTSAFKALALSGAAFAVAATWRSSSSPREDQTFSARAFDLRLLFVARLFFCSFLILAGIQHVIYAPFVDTIVPSWIPAPRFWTYFSASALLAGGTGLWLRKTARWAALLVGLMIFSWVAVVHLPRALGTRGDANETTALFEALACSGLALVFTHATSRLT